MNDAVNTGSRRVEWLLRGLAVTIVVAGMVDPAFTRTRPVAPVIAWREVPASSGTAAQARANALQDLAGVGNVVRGAVPEPQATVLWGSHIPADLLTGAAPPRTGPLVIVPTATSRGLAVEAVHLPRMLHPSERAQVLLRLSRDTHSRDAGGLAGPVTVQLQVNGVLRDQRVDRVAPNARRVVSLPFTADSNRLQDITLLVADGEDTLRLRHTLAVTREPWRVLFFDARPSWLSTFVRRALEQDARFAVSARTVTSTNVSVATPQVAAGIDALLSAAQTDASTLPDLVVVGAPERLTVREVQQLRALSVVWGRAVLILPDHLPETANRVPANTTAARQALDSLLGQSGWQRITSGATPQAVVAHPRAALDSTLLAGVTLAHARGLADDAIPLLVWESPTRTQPVVWMRMVGDGVIATSGAFDSWQYRDPERSTFSDTWRQLASRLAASSAPRLRVQRLSSESVDSTGAFFAFAVSVGGRDSLARLRVHGDDSLPPRASLNAQTGSVAPVTVYATNQPHTWLAQGRLPASGLWTLTAARGRDTVRLGLPVHDGTGVESAASSEPTPREQPLRDQPPRELLEAWARATGGALLPATRASELPTLVRSLIQTSSSLPTRPAPWHPMRSGWWILPLTLALGGEWWLRRRRGAR